MSGPEQRALGLRIRERRQMLGISQKALARQVGISPSYLNLIEHRRRRIGGRLLLAIAGALGCSPTALSEGSGEAALSALVEAAGSDPDARAELARAEEISVRMPGWARLIRRQRRRIRELEATLRLLNDRLAHDPVMAGRLHDLLSVATAIRASAAILAGPEPPDREWQARFLRNIREDSRRLAEAARGLARLLEAEAEDAATQQLLPQEALQAWLERHGHRFEALEPRPGGRSEDVPAPEHVLAREGAGLDPRLRGLAHAWLARYRAEAVRLPRARLAAALCEMGMAEALPAASGMDAQEREGQGEALPVLRLDARRLDPVALAARLDCPQSLVLSRLAALPGAAEPPAGFVACDGAGALIRRQGVEGFAMPRQGPACPLWPLFGALSRPGQMQRDSLMQAGSHPRRFVAWSLAEALPRREAGAPQLFGASMLLVPLEGGGGRDEGQAAARRVGPECRLCPVRGCAARRAPSILVGGARDDGRAPQDGASDGDAAMF